MSSLCDDELWGDLPLFAPEGTVVPKIEDGVSPEHLPESVAALSHLLYDEDSPQEIAENLRAEGNVFFKHGTKQSLKRALEKYSDAIAVRCDLPEVTSAAYGNRAATQLKLMNYGKALKDAEQALLLDPGNVKCRYRAAVSARTLRKHDVAIAHCAAALDTLRTDNIVKSRDAMLIHREMKAAEEEKQKAEAAEMLRRRTVSDMQVRQLSLSKLLRAREVTMGLPLFSQQRKYAVTTPTYDEETAGLLWPVLVVYPEVPGGNLVEQSDYLEQVSEHATINEILATLFPEGSPPPVWDTSGLYTTSRNTLTVKYRREWTMRKDDADSDDERSFVGSSLGPDDTGVWKEVANKATLGAVIAKQDYIVPLFPVLYVFPH